MNTENVEVLIISGGLVIGVTEKEIILGSVGNGKAFFTINVLLVTFNVHVKSYEVPYIALHLILFVSLGN